MPFFTRAEVNEHISKSGKYIDSNISTHSVPTSVRKATKFLQDEYLKEIVAASDDSYFYFKSECHHSFKKNDPLQLCTLCIVSGKVEHAYCTCVDGAIGVSLHDESLQVHLASMQEYQ